MLHVPFINAIIEAMFYRIEFNTVWLMNAGCPYGVTRDGKVVSLREPANLIMCVMFEFAKSKHDDGQTIVLR